MLTFGFITLSVTAMLIVLYLGLSSVRRGLEAKNNSPSRKNKIEKKVKPKKGKGSFKRKKTKVLRQFAE